MTAAPRMESQAHRLEPRSFFGALLIAVAALALLANLLSMRALMTQAEPLEPWESGFTVEAWRVSQGQPVYVAPDAGKATHMYGPLMQEIVGPLVRFTGPDVRAGRVVNAAASLIGIAFLVVLLCPAADWWRRAVYFSLLLSTHNFALAYFAVHKPDAIGIFVALLGLVLHYRAMARLAARPVLSHLAAAALMVVAFFLKQNIAGLALAAPLGYGLAWILRLEPLRVGRLAWACLPPLAVFGAIVVLRLFFETPFLYLIRLPAAYPIHLRAFVEWTFFALKAYPLVLLVAGMALAARARWLPRTADAYVAATVAVAWLISTSAAAKQGGNQNSMLAFLVVLVAAAIYAMERIEALQALQRFAARGGWLARAVAVLVVALAACSLFPREAHKFWGEHDAARSRQYREAVAQVASIPGAVLSPEDPTITLGAGKEPGLNLYLEFNLTEVLGRPGRRWPTAELEQLLLQAPAIVEVKFLFLGYFNLFDAQGLLLPRGYTKTWENDGYALWQRAR